VAALVTLPQRLLAEARRKKVPTVATAILVQTAVAVELLLMTVVRVGNLASINLDRNLIRANKRGGCAVYLTIRASEVKNNTDIEAELPPPTVALLDAYLKTYRPLLQSASSPWLFPGRNGRHKGANFLGTQISRVIARKTGLHINPHLFRHIGAKLYLDKNPGAYGLVRLIHGHKSVETTTKYYCGNETPAAMRHFDECILRLREQAETGGLKSPPRAAE
jgi:integrase